MGTTLKLTDGETIKTEEAIHDLLGRLEANANKPRDFIEVETSEGHRIKVNADQVVSLREM